MENSDLEEDAVEVKMTNSNYYSENYLKLPHNENQVWVGQHKGQSPFQIERCWCILNNPYAKFICVFLCFFFKLQSWNNRFGVLETDHLTEIVRPQVRDLEIWKGRT